MASNMIFELAYESKNYSGTMMVLASNEREAIKRFRDNVNDKGIAMPSYWVAGIWSVN